MLTSRCTKKPHSEGRGLKIMYSDTLSSDYITVLVSQPPVSRGSLMEHTVKWIILIGEEVVIWRTGLRISQSFDIHHSLWFWRPVKACYLSDFCFFSELLENLHNLFSVVWYVLGFLQWYMKGCCVFIFTIRWRFHAIPRFWVCYQHTPVLLVLPTFRERHF